MADEQPTGTEAEGGGQRRVHWDDTKMVTNFANVVNVTSTREEVTLFFGTNQTWNVTDEQQVKVELTNRVILTPFAAKRLLMLVGGLLKEYESRYGMLEIETGGQRPGGA